MDRGGAGNGGGRTPGVEPGPVLRPLPVPAAGAGSAAMPLWDFQGSTMVTSQYVRLTPDERSREGSIWNRVVSTGMGVRGVGGAGGSPLALS